MDPSCSKAFIRLKYSAKRKLWNVCGRNALIRAHNFPESPSFPKNWDFFVMTGMSVICVCTSLPRVVIDAAERKEENHRFTFKKINVHVLDV